MLLAAHLEVKGVLTVLVALELILVQVRPAPDTSIDHVGETLIWWPPEHYSVNKGKIIQNRVQIRPHR